MHSTSPCAELVDRVEAWSTCSEPPTDHHDFFSETEEMLTSHDKVERNLLLDAEEQKAKQKQLNDERIKDKKRHRMEMAGGILSNFNLLIRR